MTVVDSDEYIPSGIFLFVFVVSDVILFLIHISDNPFPAAVILDCNNFRFSWFPVLMTSGLINSIDDKLENSKTGLRAS